MEMGRSAPSWGVPSGAWYHVMHGAFIFCLIWCYSECACSGQSYSQPLTCNDNSSKLGALRHLLKDYDRTLRPTHSQGTATHVTCNVFINSFDSISVNTMDFSVNIYMRQSWTDERLAYKHLFPNQTSLALDYRSFEYLWLPDVFFPNEKAASTHCVTVPNAMIRIHPNGRILYSTRYSLKLACHMDLRKFPLDLQECHMRIESYSSTLEELKLQWKMLIPLQVNKELELPQFNLIAIDTTTCKQSYVTGDFACLEAVFTLQRQYGYFMIQTYVPSILIVTLSWVSFWINIDAVPARISLGVLTVLTLTTQCVGVWMSLPRISYVKAIDVWMSTCIFMVYTAMLEFAVVNTLARKEIRRMSMRVRARHQQQHGDQQSDAPHRSTFLMVQLKQMMDEYAYGLPQKYDKNSRMLARKVDKVARWVFPGIFICFNISYWCYYNL